MKKLFITILISVIPCISNAQTLEVETLGRFLYMSEDSISVYLLCHQWNYSLTDSVMKLYSNPNNGYEMIGIVSKNSIVTNINYMINEPVSEQFKQKIGVVNGKSSYNVDSISKDNRFMISIAPKYKYNYFTLYECKELFLKRIFSINHSISYKIKKRL